MAEILVLNGPNLNLLGTREPDRYGTKSLADVEDLVAETARQFGHAVCCVQSNHEGELVDAIHAAAARGAIGAVVNAGAYTHTSVALRDAFSATRLPFVEVHISNVFARESFRHKSLLSDVAIGVIGGCGVEGYRFAVEVIARRVV